jgi:hypothetical protein
VDSQCDSFLSLKDILVLLLPIFGTQYIYKEKEKRKEKRKEKEKAQNSAVLNDTIHLLPLNVQ